MRRWRIEDSAELYNITGWGLKYFSINDNGHVQVTPREGCASVDLKELMDELQIRDITAPVLLRFPDILDNRIEKISRCFKQAAEEYKYGAQNFIIYPIKVNQMRQVVDEIVSHGKKFNIGLEAGSKPELHAVLATNIDEHNLIICNGYKDENYVELALLAQKMGRRIFLVVEKLNELGGKNGIGLLDIVENRLVGMKSRGVYETPGGTILYKAHQMLEMITLDRDTAHYKKLVAEKYGELVYNGLWFSPLREALDAFVNKTQETVTGDVKLKLYKGNVMNAGITSPYTLYDETVASFGDDGGAYNQKDSAGFINLFGLPLKVKALLDQKLEANED